MSISATIYIVGIIMMTSVNERHNFHDIITLSLEMIMLMIRILTKITR